MQAHIMTPVD